MTLKRPKCPQCREECVTIIQYREAALARDYPKGVKKLLSTSGEVLRYEMQCLRCRHCWRPRDQSNAEKLFDEVPQ